MSKRKILIRHGKGAWAFVQDMYEEWINDNCFKLAAALSYYTIFSLPPIIIVVIYSVGTFYGREAFSGEIFDNLSQLIGDEAAVAFKQRPLRNERGQGRLIRDVEAHGKHPRSRCNGEQVIHGERLEKGRSRDGRQQQRPNCIGRDHDRPPAPAIREDAGGQTEQENGDSTGRRQDTHVERCCPENQDSRHWEPLA